MLAYFFESVLSDRSIVCHKDRELYLMQCKWIRPHTTERPNPREVMFFQYEVSKLVTYMNELSCMCSMFLPLVLHVYHNTLIIKYSEILERFSFQRGTPA